MEAFWQSLVPVLRDLAPLIVAAISIIALVWRVPSKGDMNRMEDRLTQRMDRQDDKIDDTRASLDAKIDDTRAELLMEIKAVDAKVDRVDERLSETNEHYFELRGDVKALSRDVAALTDKTSRIERDLEATRNAAP